MPQYAILIYEKETPGGVADIPPDVMEANMRAGEKIAEMGAKFVNEQALQPSASADRQRSPPSPDYILRTTHRAMPRACVGVAGSISHTSIGNIRG